jgi:hypothetical protein
MKANLLKFIKTNKEKSTKPPFVPIIKGQMRKLRHFRSKHINIRNHSVIGVDSLICGFFLGRRGAFSLYERQSGFINYQ